MVIDHVCCTRVRQLSSCDMCCRFQECLEKRSTKQSDGKGLGRLVAEDQGCRYFVSDDGSCVALTNISGSVIEVPESIVGGRRKVLLPKDDAVRWRDLAETVFKAFRGPVPDGTRISFRDKNPLNCSLDNIVAIEKNPESEGDGRRYIVIIDGFSSVFSTPARAAKKAGIKTCLMLSLIEQSKRGEVRIRPGVYVSSLGGGRHD